MSGDELIVTLIALGLGPVAWLIWLWQAGSVDSLRRSTRQITAVVIGALIGAAVIIGTVISTAAADDVRGVAVYEVMYLLMGLAWLRITSWLLPFIGLNPWDDLVERRNDSATIAWIGVIIGAALAYAGGNIGNGPGWWVVVFSALLATAGIGVLWLAVANASAIVDAVMVDRDLAAGWRLAGLCVAGGIVCGYGVTGDWISAPVTVVDFVTRGWPLLLLAAIAIGIERANPLTPERPHAPVVAGGIAPAALYVAVAIAGVVVMSR